MIYRILAHIYNFLFAPKIYTHKRAGNARNSTEGPILLWGKPEDKNTWQDMSKDDFEAYLESTKKNDEERTEEFEKKKRMEYILSFAGIFEGLDDEVFDNLTVNLHENRLKDAPKIVE